MTWGYTIGVVTLAMALVPVVVVLVWEYLDRRKARRQRGAAKVYR